MITIYLSLNGNSKEAAAYYAKVFGGEVAMQMTFDQVPEEEKVDMPENVEDLVMYANVKTFAGDIMLSDMMPGTEVTPNEGVWLCVSHDDHARLEEVFNTLAEEGEVVMPMEETFFSPLYGQVKDKYGFYWMIMSSEGE